MDDKKQQNKQGKQNKQKKQDNQGMNRADQKARQEKDQNKLDDKR